MKTITTVACFLLYFTSSLGSCPNECSSHGTCDKFSRCTCSDNFQGADCSEWVRFTYNGNYCYVHNNGNWTLTSNNFKKICGKICPFATAWSDQATATDTAHNRAECSNRGICDRSTGYNYNRTIYSTVSSFNCCFPNFMSCTYMNRSMQLYEWIHRLRLW